MPDNSNGTRNDHVFKLVHQMGHEQIVFCNDEVTGLKAIIAIHNTILGPALGGTRMWNYRSEDDALVDVLRLSRGMTFKAAVTGLHLGGGKAVIIGDARKDKSEALMRRYGKFLQSLSGKYYTAEDVGTSTQDMVWISRETQYVTGIPEYMGGSGDPSPFTAYGVYLGMKAAVKEYFGDDSLSGKKIALQGTGHVGSQLLERMVQENARVYVTDLYEDRLKDVAGKFKVEVVKPDEIYDVDAEIYAPCALGATINDETLKRLKCKVIAGAANNQLADEDRNGQMLLDKGILYAPDFLINAGGLINVGMELETYSRERVWAECEQIYDRTMEIFRHAKARNIPTYHAALELAEERIKSIAALNERK
jgi:leucine dehydrogenase